MAAAGVDYHVGREAKATYGEKWNGVQTGVLHHRHHFGVLKEPISPYVVPGDPKSGVLPRISTAQPGEYGAGRQARAGLLLPHVPDRPSREPHPVREARRLRPEAVRTAAARLRGRLARDVRQVRSRSPTARPTRNNHGPFSTDNIGLQLRLSRGLVRAPPRDPEGARDLPEGLALLHRQRPARAEGRAGRGCASGACRRTSSRTTAAGRTRSTCARRGGWWGSS